MILFVLCLTIVVRLMDYCEQSGYLLFYSMNVSHSNIYILVSQIVYYYIS